MQHRMKDMLQTIRDAVTNGTIVECQGNLTLVCITRVMAVLLMTACTLAQTTDDPFSTPIAAGKRAIEVGIVGRGTREKRIGEIFDVHARKGWMLSRT